MYAISVVWQHIQAFPCVIQVISSLFSAVPKHITEVFCPMMVKWWCCAAVAWYGNGGLRYKSLVFRFDLRCFQMQTTCFMNTDTMFYELQPPHSEYDYPNSRHNSLIFKPEFHHFQHTISANQHTTTLFSLCDYLRFRIQIACL